MSDHKMNRRNLRVAAARYCNHQTEERFTAVEYAFAQVQFDRMEKATEPGPVDETPDNDPDQADCDATPELDLESKE